MGRGLYFPGDNGHAWHIDNECFSWTEDQHGTPYNYPVFDSDLFADELRNITDELKSLFPSLYSVSRWTMHDESIVLENAQVEIGWTSDYVYTSVFIRTKDDDLWPYELPLAEHNCSTFAVKIQALLLSLYPDHLYTGSGWCASKLTA